MKFVKSMLFGGAFMLSLSGCVAVVGHEDSLKSYNARYIATNCEVSDLASKIKSDDDAMLSANQAGALMRQCEDFNASNYYFDIAESKYKDAIDEKNALVGAGSEIGSALVNENMLDYEGYYYERVMTNIYKSLNFMSMKNYDNARVELNRAIDRQRRAKDMYEKQLQKARENLKKDTDTQSKESDNHNNAQIASILSSYESSIGEFEALPKFINPFTSYISGIFFFMEKNYEKSRDLLKEAFLMNKKNPQLQSDIALVDKFFSSSKGKHKNERYVWVIYENGQTINRTETRYDIPLFVLTSKVPHVGIALPMLDRSQSSFEFIKVNNKPTTIIADMDAVVKTEFKEQMPLEITRAVTRAISKAALSVGAKKLAGDIGTVLTGLYSASTNKTDVRYWSTLPQNFQSLCVENNGQELNITTNGGALIKKIILKKGANGIIYVKSLTPQNVSLNEIYF